MTDYKEIRKDMYERFHASFEKLYISELKDQLADKDELITAQDHIIAELQSRLPEEMPDCAIVFEECEVGHGSLRGTNWIKTDCPHCKIADQQAEIEGFRSIIKDLERRLQHAESLVEEYRMEGKVRDEKH